MAGVGVVEVDKLENGTGARASVSETTDKVASGDVVLHPSVIRSYSSSSVIRAEASAATNAGAEIQAGNSFP